MQEVAFHYRVLGRWRGFVWQLVSLGGWIAEEEVDIVATTKEAQDEEAARKQARVRELGKARSKAYRERVKLAKQGVKMPRERPLKMIVVEPEAIKEKYAAVERKKRGSMGNVVVRACVRAREDSMREKRENEGARLWAGEWAIQITMRGR